jgi:hypothetical protein
MTVKTTAKRDWQTVRDELTTARDEIRLKLHLGGMDVKQQWTSLEEQLRDLEHKAELSADHVADAVIEAANRLKKDMEKVRANLV